MVPEQMSSLQMPSFLHGMYSTVRQKTRKEGKRCGEQYLKNSSFPSPHQMLEVPLGEVVMVHEVADFHHERPAWRLYLASDVMSGLYESLDWQNVFPVRDAYEAFCRETAWGALYFATSPTGPVSAARTALRLQAVLRFWEPLRSARYLFNTFDAELTLEELLSASCDWAMDAWCPAGEASVHKRLEMAVKRMARATREDSIEAILRQMPRVLSFARGLKHRDVVADPAFQRQRLTALDPLAFEHVSGACTADLLEKLYDWDRQLGKQ
ncbi:hypothetical protein [Melittangium boletus]|uniref:Uncharacterized protein n=1 Tax=Melittangium boletus DSM 14713 TaxID=1294270 RepID=A0A250I6B3_9BACT|nr:hypothetical protein [Melittangium boletus]ATB26723.1 hypothetical protein MEBOL_000157 [Melittangium boletus DSM 14713]